VERSNEEALRSRPSPQRGETFIEPGHFLNLLRSDRSETSGTFRSSGARNISAGFGSINILLLSEQGTLRSFSRAHIYQLGHGAAAFRTADVLVVDWI
jgi:hypothetical protein